MMRQRTAAALAAVAVLMSGCGTVDYTRRMQAAGYCCERYPEIRYVPLEFDKAIRQEVGGENDSLRHFAEGASFFSAFKLPTYQRPYEVQITSTRVNGQLFVPTILVLDDRYREIRRIEGDAFEYSNGTLRHAFFVNEDQRASSYILLYARKDRLGRTNSAIDVSSSTMPIYAGAYMFYYTQHQEIKTTVWTAPGGQLTVLAKSYAPRVLGAEK